MKLMNYKVLIIFALFALNATDYSNKVIVGQSFRGQKLAGAKFRGSIIQNTDFAFANLAGADFTTPPGGHTKIGNDVSFYCANLKGMNYDQQDAATNSYIQLQVAATQENFDTCKAIADYLHVTLPYTKQDLPEK